MAEVTLDRVSVDLTEARVLHDISFGAHDGEFVAIVGSSGSGKSTVLRVIAGLVEASTGTVRFDGRDVTAVPPADRDIGMVFQHVSLIEHRNVRRNVAFPLEVRRQTAQEIRQRVDAEVRSLHIEHLLLRRPGELSVGEQQLVQIARTMVRVPTVLLLDEPFSPLDEHLRHRLRLEIGLLQRGYGVTTIMATNDPRDAVSLADRLVVVEAGRVAQIGTPDEIRGRPSTLDVAHAVGDISVISAEVHAAEQGYWLLAEGRDDVPTFRNRAWAPGLESALGSTIAIAIRPHAARLDSAGEIDAIVDRVVPGSEPHVVVRTAAGILRVAGDDAGLNSGDPVRIQLDESLLFDLATRRRIN